MAVNTVHLSKQLYERILHLAQQANQPPDRVVEAILWEHFPVYPHIELKRDQWGEYAIVAGTRTSVAAIVRYAHKGHDAQAIATEILPHLTLTQVHSALAYYFEHQETMDAEIAADTDQVWQARLKELVGEQVYQTLVGTADD